MSNDIKDYLHLYVGGRIKSKGGKTGDLVSVSNDGMAIVVYDSDKINDPRGLCVNSDWLYLILRPLSDIKNEEKKELLHLIGEPLMYRLHDFDLTDSGFIEVFQNGSGGFFGFTPSAVVYLLKQGFDLFGLIGKGLAITGQQ